jgi:hypothetical protein
MEDLAVEDLAVEDLAIRDLQSLIFRLRDAAAECAALDKLSVDDSKRQFFRTLSGHLASGAEEIEKRVAVPKQVAPVTRVLARDQDYVAQLTALEYVILASTSPAESVSTRKSGN